MANEGAERVSMDPMEGHCGLTRGLDSQVVGRTLCPRLAGVKTLTVPATQDVAAVLGLLKTDPRSLISRLEIRLAQLKKG